MTTPEAPCHLSNSEASAWEAGYERAAAEIKSLQMELHALKCAGPASALLEMNNELRRQNENLHDESIKVTRELRLQIEAFQKLEAAFDAERELRRQIESLQNQSEAALVLALENDGTEMLEAQAEVRELRRQNAELRECLKVIASVHPAHSHLRLKDVPEYARKALAAQPEGKRDPFPGEHLDGGCP